MYPECIYVRLVIVPVVVCDRVKREARIRLFLVFPQASRTDLEAPIERCPAGNPVERQRCRMRNPATQFIDDKCAIHWIS